MNWMRANLAWIASQSVRTVSVLASPGHALEKDVATREQADEDALDHVLLADDDLADLVGEAVDEGALLGDELVQGADVVHGGAPRKGGLRGGAPRRGSEKKGGSEKGGSEKGWRKRTSIRRAF